MQQKWLTKLLGLSYEIQYRAGTRNTIADSLSRREDVGSECQSITQVLPTWITEVMQSYKQDRIAQKHISELLRKPGVQIVDVRLSTKAHNGGLISLEELCKLLGRRCKKAHEAVAEDG
ncbi:hypothetical protein ACH5RR_007193 [Cinchona calisaya]|uniref:Reverse transcriptase RNase H-like domain-containing protein n=1 Tax=Cinchona calisaya TaxID=153742 RepID=A0ABD3AR31_9GENT